ncbi:MAG: radical SAM protein [Candidatus Goldiibacteriota bacterium]|jgi:anaerobic magnesium-protoporphyrin IX monomethyl ester cyclase
MKNPGISRVLLVRPAPSSEQFGDESFMPLGIAYIAAALKKEGYEVQVNDLLIERMGDEAFLKNAFAFAPDVVGFTAVTPVVKSAFRLAGLIKKSMPETVTIIGGPHATAMPEECLENSFDFVVSGEGEAAIADLLENIKNPEKVNSILYKKNGQTVKTPDRGYIENLDSIKFPARELFPPLSKYRGQEALGSLNPVGSIMTSRGCPYACKFCFKAVFGNKFRMRTAENVLEEWMLLVNEYKVREIAVVDDSFTTDVGRVHKICDSLIKAKVKTRWSCPNGIRVDLGGYEMLKKMADAGCRRVALGIESGSQKVLDSIGKKTTLKQIEETVKNCRRAGIKTMGFYMLGNLGETEETMNETINFAKKVRTDYAQFLIAIPYPGTPLYEEIKKNGKLYINDWDQYGQYEERACFEYGGLNPELLSKMSGRARRGYYLDPAYIFSQLLNPETYYFAPRRIKAALRMITGAK